MWRKERRTKNGSSMAGGRAGVNNRHEAWHSATGPGRGSRYQTAEILLKEDVYP